MAQHYAAHALDEDFKAVSDATADAFGDIVIFPRVVGE